MEELSKILVAAAAADSKITWTSSAVSTLLFGVAGQVIAAAALLIFVALNSLLCLCRMLLPCCKSQRFAVILAIAKLAIALGGVLALGTQMTALTAAIKATAESPLGMAAASLAGVSSPNALLILGAAAILPVNSGGAYGQALGSLGVALLGVSVLLNVLLLIKCGGAKHHVASDNSKAVATSRV
jgi:hypothetical protein